jgi:hypothetical protein
MKEHGAMKSKVDNKNPGSEVKGTGSSVEKWIEGTGS